MTSWSATSREGLGRPADGRRSSRAPAYAAGRPRESAAADFGGKAEEQSTPLQPEFRFETQHSFRQTGSVRSERNSNSPGRPARSTRATSPARRSRSPAPCCSRRGRSPRRPADGARFQGPPFLRSGALRASATNVACHRAAQAYE